MNIDLGLDPSIPAEVIGNLLQKLGAYYVFPDTAAKLCESLQEHLESTRYPEWQLCQKDIQYPG